MSLLKSDYLNVIHTIEAIAALGVSPITGRCEHVIDDILTSLNTLYPDDTLTLSQLQALLTRGVRSGVFRQLNLTDTCPVVLNLQSPGPQCSDGSDIVMVLYSINNQMVYANQANAVYAAYFRTPVAGAVDSCTGASSGQFEGGTSVNYAANTGTFTPFSEYGGANSGIFF